MAHKNGTFATIDNRMQHCGHYNYSYIDLEIYCNLSPQ